MLCANLSRQTQLMNLEEGLVALHARFSCSLLQTSIVTVEPDVDAPHLARAIALDRIKAVTHARHDGRRGR